MIFIEKNVEIGKKFHATQTEPKYKFVKFWHVSVRSLMLLCSNDYVEISRPVANGRSLRRNTAI